MFGVFMTHIFHRFHTWDVDHPFGNLLQTWARKIKRVIHGFSDCPRPREFSQPRARFRPPEELEHLHVSSSESDPDDGERAAATAATSHAASSRARRATRKQVLEERDGHRDWMTWWNTQWIGFLGTIFTGKIFSYEKWKKSDGFRWRCSQENQSQSLVTLVWPSGQWPKLLMSLFGDIDLNYSPYVPMLLTMIGDLMQPDLTQFHLSLYEKQIPLHVSRNWCLDKWRTFHDPFTDKKLVDQPLPGPRSQTLPRPSWWWKASPRACRTAVAACCAERPWTSCAIMTLGHGDTRISLAP